MSQQQHHRQQNFIYDANTYKKRTKAMRFSLNPYTFAVQGRYMTASIEKRQTNKQTKGLEINLGGAEPSLTILTELPLAAALNQLVLLQLSRFTWKIC